LPLPCAADTQPKEQRRLRNAPMYASKSGGPPLLLQESLKRSLQRTESLHSGRNAASTAAINPPACSAAKPQGNWQHAVAAVAPVPVETGYVNGKPGQQAAPQLPLQGIPFKVPECNDAAECPLSSSDVHAATTGVKQPSKKPPSEQAKSAQNCADAGVPDWCDFGIGFARRLVFLP